MIDALGDRFKSYENTFDFRLPNRIPVVVRIDGKAFHSWTKKSKCVKPFDDRLVNLMANTTKYLCENISGCVCGYCQSDEISLLLINSQTNQTQPWFDNSDISNIPAFFDSRTFVVPEKDVINYFIWRQTDASRNSISMLAQSLYSHKELHKKNSDEKQEMCFQKGFNWNDLKTSYKRGSLIYKKTSDIPLVNKITGEITYRDKFVIDTETEIFKHDKSCIINNILIKNNIVIF